jgi:hypothetical protein
MVLWLSCFMKVTFEINDDLYRQLKVASALRGRKVKELIAEGISLVLVQAPAAPEKPCAPLPLIECGPPGTLDIPDDVAYRIDSKEDRLGHEASLR